MQMENSPKYSEEYTIRNKKITKEMKDKMKKELENKIGFVE